MEADTKRLITMWVFGVALMLVMNFVWLRCLTSRWRLYPSVAARRYVPGKTLVESSDDMEELRNVVHPALNPVVAAAFHATISSSILIFMAATQTPGIIPFSVTGGIIGLFGSIYFNVITAAITPTWKFSGDALPDITYAFVAFTICAAFQELFA